MKYMGKNISKCSGACENKHHLTEDCPAKGKGYHVRWWHGIPEQLDTSFYRTLREAKEAIKESK